MLNNTPILLIAIPLAGAFLTPILFKAWKRLAEIVAGLSIAATLAFTIYLVVSFHIGGIEMLVYRFGNWIFLKGTIPVGILFAVDNFSSFMLLVVAVLVFFSYLFGIQYMKHFTGHGKFYTLFLLMLAK